MAKSFCSGCKHWKFCQPGYGERGFHWCDRLKTWKREARKELCNGKYWEEER